MGRRTKSLRNGVLVCLPVNLTVEKFPLIVAPVKNLILKESCDDNQKIDPAVRNQFMILLSWTFSALEFYLQQARTS